MFSFSLLSDRRSLFLVLFSSATLLLLYPRVSLHAVSCLGDNASPSYSKDVRIQKRSTRSAPPHRAIQSLSRLNPLLVKIHLFLFFALVLVDL